MRITLDRRIGHRKTGFAKVFKDRKWEDWKHTANIRKAPKTLKIVADFLQRIYKFITNLAKEKIFQHSSLSVIYLLTRKIVWNISNDPSKKTTYQQEWFHLQDQKSKLGSSTLHSPPLSAAIGILCKAAPRSVWQFRSLSWYVWIDVDIRIWLHIYYMSAYLSPLHIFVFFDWVNLFLLNKYAKSLQIMVILFLLPPVQSVPITRLCQYYPSVPPGMNVTPLAFYRELRSPHNAGDHVTTGGSRGLFQLENEMILDVCRRSCYTQNHLVTSYFILHGISRIELGLLFFLGYC